MKKKLLFCASLLFCTNISAVKFGEKKEKTCLQQIQKVCKQPTRRCVDVTCNLALYGTCTGIITFSIYVVVSTMGSIHNVLLRGGHA